MTLTLLPLSLLFLGILWIALILRIDAWVKTTPRPSWLGAIVYLACLWASHRIHRVRYEGLENVPKGNLAGPFIVVSNHTAGIDPILIQCGCKTEIRWMMVREMDVGIVRFFTWFARIILVNRNGRDLASTREALRHLKNGGVLGIFAEASIENPPRLIRPFMPGVGFLVAQSGVPVLPVWVSGTPFAEDAMRALLHRSHARVVFGEMMEFDHRKAREAEAITAAIRDRIIEMSGWEATDEPTATMLDHPNSAAPG